MKLKNVLSGVLVTIFMLCMSAPIVRAEEGIEKPYLGLDPSTIIESGADAPYIPMMETYASNAIVQIDGSKKGIQGTEWITETDAAELGVKQVLVNLCMSPIMLNGDTEYIYNGKSFFFNAGYLEGYKKTVQSLNANGIAVSVVLLMEYDRNLPDWSKLVFDPEGGHNFYGLNTDTEKSRDTWGAVFSFLAEQFGQTNCQIEHWILGNEVNVPSAYNWTGTLDIDTNARVYAQSFVLLYNALQNQNNVNPSKPNAKAYISLDRAWNDDSGGVGIGAKVMLDSFAAKVDTIQPDVNWCIAFHPYAVSMDATSPNFTESEKMLWGNNPYTPNSLNARFITAANLNVLTDYVKNTYGAEHRIILSEQGFDAKGGEDYQAASLAYTFYAGQFNDMVDAVIFRAWQDHPDEFGLQLGIRGRKAHEVFKYMDTTVFGGTTSTCLSRIGIGSWDELVPGFSMPGLAYRDTSHDSWYLSSVKAVTDAGIMTGLNHTNFGAGENLARAQFATILYRMEGSPAYDYIQHFPDVKNGLFYSIPISWAADNGIIMGYENGYFGTGDSITREQLATLMFRYAQYKGRDTSGKADLSGFGDYGNVSGFATEAMKWVVEQGIIKGEGSTGHLNPQGKVPRAVCAAVIERYLGL